MDPSVFLFPFADYWWFYAGFTLFEFPAEVLLTDSIRNAATHWSLYH